MALSSPARFTYSCIRTILDSSLWLTMLLAVMVPFVFLAIYRLYFHPLCKFPGPKLAALTDYWELYQDFFREESGYLFIELDNLHQKYGTRSKDIYTFRHSDPCPAGPVLRIRPNEVHIKDSDWMDVLYTGPTDVGPQRRHLRCVFLMRMCDSPATATRWLVLPLALPLQVCQNPNLEQRKCPFLLT